MFKSKRRRQGSPVTPNGNYPYRRRPEWAPMQFIGHVQGGRHTR